MIEKISWTSAGSPTSGYSAKPKPRVTTPKMVIRMPSTIWAMTTAIAPFSASAAWKRTKRSRSLYIMKMISGPTQPRNPQLTTWPSTTASCENSAHMRESERLSG